MNIEEKQMGNEVSVYCQKGIKSIVRFLDGEGNTEKAQYKLFELNAATARDNPSSDGTYKQTFENFKKKIVQAHWFRSDGQLLAIDGERFVGLGAVGVITKITLKVEPAYEMRQNIYLNLPFSEIENHFNAIMASAYSISLFTLESKETTYTTTYKA